MRNCLRPATRQQGGLSADGRLEGDWTRLVPSAAWSAERRGLRGLTGICLARGAIILNEEVVWMPAICVILSCSRPSHAQGIPGQAMLKTFQAKPWSRHYRPSHAQGMTGQALCMTTLPTVQEWVESRRPAAWQPARHRGLVDDTRRRGVSGPPDG